MKPANLKENRRDRGLLRNHNGKRKVLVIMREHGGSSVPAVFHSEAQAMSFIGKQVARGRQHRRSLVLGCPAQPFEMKCINHRTVSMAPARIWRKNFSACAAPTPPGQYLLRYAQEATWREDNRLQSNGDQVRSWR